ncbi:hypothetical protein [Pseudoponticoccus marisrubri]|uniref:Uncharacterized protein n=1 Tax=Pseudoponticoccus marisrubri TaxID=1685382 RepID=A0A0W7WGP6_9RHOB|nr:hypothetical protein [Pseudoponticoccus marisrubri]KUF09640.1 hypothetical protein AVJ23_15885 [Pseudoponticoccus marisrubri]
MFVLTEKAAAQQMRINNGCPSLGTSNVGQYTIEQLNKLCHDEAQSGGQVKPAENGAALTCGQHRFMAMKARIDVSYSEGVASQQVVDKYCTNKPDSALPDQSYEGGDKITGTVRFERGYDTRWSGRKASICQRYYSGRAYIENGRIEFNSGGHTWRGTISQSSYISITRNGVTPRPKNHTVISGPMFDAELYNGYCGAGFFRLVAD